MSDALEHLLSPIQIGPMELRNRVICTGHDPNYAEDGLIGEKLVAFHVQKAKGGVALSTTGVVSVHPSGGMVPMAQLVDFDDSVIPRYRRLADAMHAEGARMMVQLNHSSSSRSSHHMGHPMWAPSQTIGAYGREAPHVMTKSEIETVLHAFHASAARVRLSGLDGVELNLFAGGLPQQFISPITNQRTDEYGGSDENRLRFVHELIQTCRDALGPDRALALKIAGDELAYYSMHLRDMQEVVQHLDAPGLIDYYVVAAGTNLDRFARVDHWPPAPAAHGLYAHLAAGIKSVTTRPVAAVGRIIDPRMADQLIASGICDLVAMVRATIADPDLVKKAAAGRLDEIRPCVGASSGCIDRILQDEEARCIYNPIIGHEREWGEMDRAKLSRRVVVIGGGPGGLEAARVAATRGHTVILLERARRLGGAVLDMARKPGREELGGIAAWLSSEVLRLGVDVRLKTEASVANVLREKPEVVILASGARDAAPHVDGQRIGARVISAWAAIREPAALGHHVVVVDEFGQDLGCAVAELVADRGGRAEVVSPNFHPAIDAGLTNTTWLYRRLFRKGVGLTPHHNLSHVEDRQVTIANVYSGVTRSIPDVDTVVVVTPPQPNDELLEPLRRAGLVVLPIGDCVAPRDVENAIFEAHRAAREI